MKKTARNEAMLSMYLEGFTMEDVGEAFCVTRQRVHQILGGRKHQGRERNLIPRKAVQKRLSADHRFLHCFLVGNDCWEWTRGKYPTGYGSFRCSHGYAHRYAYEMFVGVVPDGLHVMHTCDNPGCVNPLHLMVGTHKINMHRRDVNGRSGTTKFTKQQILDIKAEYTGEFGQQTSLAKRYDVTVGTIWNLVNGHTYKFWTGGAFERKAATS